MNDFMCTCLNERVDNRPTFTIGNRGVLNGKSRQNKHGGR